MKRCALFSALLLGSSGLLSATDLQFRAAYFRPQDHHIRRIYEDALPEYELEGAGPVINKYWALWGNLSYYGKHGRSSCLHNRTHMQNWALTFGLKRYVYQGDPFRIYFGLGLGPDYARFHNHSHAVPNVHQWGLATLAKFGIECMLTKLLFLDFFTDYSYNWVPTKHSRHCVSSWNLNTGGFKAGVGFGFRF